MILDYIIAGGVIMIPLLALSALLLAVAIDRFMVIRRSYRELSMFFPKYTEVIHKYGKIEAMSFANSWRLPLSKLYIDILQLPNTETDKAVRQLAERQDKYVGYLKNRLNLFNIITYLSPLLGLLGTVLGMVSCFKNLETTSSTGIAHISTLSGGIWQALITTVAGLIISIISYVLANITSYYVNTFLKTVESTVIDTISSLNKSSRYRSKVGNAV